MALAATAFQGFSAELLKKVADIPLPGGATRFDYASLDAAAGRLYFSHMGDGKLMVFDIRAGKLVTNLPGFARHDLKKGKHPHGFYIDAIRGRAYISCQGDNKLIVFNLESHQEEEVFPVKEDPDVLAFDNGLNLLYVSCESGGVSIFKAEPAKLVKQGDVEVGPNSHTVCVDSKTHKAYFPLKNLNGRPVLRIMLPNPENPNPK